MNTASFGSMTSQNSILIRHSGQIMKRISSCTAPWLRTAPPRYLLAKSACKFPRDTSISVPSSQTRAAARGLSRPLQKSSPKGSSARLPKDTTSSSSASPAVATCEKYERRQSTFSSSFSSRDEKSKDGRSKALPPLPPASPCTQSSGSAPKRAAASRAQHCLRVRKTCAVWPRTSMRTPRPNSSGSCAARRAARARRRTSTGSSPIPRS
mmetsp:Transcript_100885/g.311166  ORF Transcript_100885/g.311166 Transcript_100885/m.311166 type:complete len:210 (+) Transcript_100885:748-1377(+)